MSESRIHVVVGLGFGDEGKGSIVDYLVRRDEAVGTVVRFNGGPQAAHRVVDADGREHVCSQFGAGILVPGVRTHLARGMLVSPPNLLMENDGLRRIGIRDGLGRLTIDPDCVIITPFHVLANRALELARGDGRHGSCGQGVGEARRDQLDGHVLYAHECKERSTLLAKLRELQAVASGKLEGVDIPPSISPSRDPRWALESLDAVFPLVDLYSDWRWLACIDNGEASLRDAFTRGNVVFEGAQGVLLDENYGFHPYSTWTNTTAENAYALLSEHGQDGHARTIGVTRAYATRHGAGPLPTEDPALTGQLPDPENGDGTWQGRFRVGWFDLPMLRYALGVCPVDAVAVTCLDRIAAFPDWQAAVLYEGREPLPPLARCVPYDHAANLTPYMEKAKPMLIPLEPSAYAYGWVLQNFLNVPMEIASTGPTAADKCVFEAAEAAA